MSYIVLGAGAAVLLSFVYWNFIIRPRAGKPALSDNLTFVIVVGIITITVAVGPLVQGADSLPGTAVFVLVMGVGTTFHLLVVAPFLRGGKK